MTPQIRYARNGDINIAYQVVGSGLGGLVLVAGWVTNIEVFWEEQTVVRFLERLAAFSRLTIFDKRGTGLSARTNASFCVMLSRRSSSVLVKTSPTKCPNSLSLTSKTSMLETTPIDVTSSA